MREEDEEVPAAGQDHAAVVPQLVWEIGQVECGPDIGKPVFYTSGDSETPDEARFSGTEDALLAKYPELTGNRY